MKIQIEYKNKEFIVTYGKSVGKGVTVREAIDNMVTHFKAELEKFFLQK